MKFTQPAFVRVENPAERKELKEWLKNIGYDRYGPDPECAIMVATTNGGFLKDMHDCGTNVDLFRALAAMNDSNDREQWFVCTKSYNAVGRYWCKGDWFFVERPCGPDSPLWRKATASEIIEYFSRKQ